MLPPEKYKTASLVDMLMSCPSEDRGRWAGALVLRALETHGYCSYSSDEKRLNDATFTQVA